MFYIRDRNVFKALQSWGCNTACHISFRIFFVTCRNCVFPRCCTPVQSSQIRIINKKHPITKGVPATFTIPETEMYDEPFHVPTPDEVVLDETWKGGEYFRSGAIWSLGKGKVFYFRPGDQQYAVYKLKPVLRIIENAAVWLGGK